MTRMSDVYAAFGPLPSSLGVTPSPTPPEDGDAQRRYANLNSNQIYANLHPNSSHIISSPQTDDEILHKNANATMGRHAARKSHVRHRHKTMARSHQDLRRTISKAAMERAPEPLQLLQRLDSLDNTAANLRSSIPNLDMDTPSPIFFDRRRNGSALPGPAPTYASSPCNVHIYSNAVGRHSSKEQLEADEDDRKCCSRMRVTYCKVFCSILVCVFLLAGVVAALYFFIKSG